MQKIQVMRVFFGVLIFLGSILILTLKVFRGYSTHNILSNQAGFELYLDTNEMTIDEFFNLEQGTYDPEHHLIICKLPVSVQGFKAKNALVKTNLKTINCQTSFDDRKDVKYEPYELKIQNFEFMIIKKYGMDYRVFEEKGRSERIIAKRVQIYNYRKGRINRLITSKNGLYDYCF